MSYICTKYPGDCVVTEVFCSKRYKKALDSPDDGGLEFCRSCDKGKTAWEALKVEAAPSPLCSICGHPMKNMSGICKPCRAKTVKENGPTPEKHEVIQQKPGPKGGIMRGLISKKTCVDCGEEYEPTSNVQKRCLKCKTKWQVKRNKSYNERKKKLQIEDTDNLQRIAAKFPDNKAKENHTRTSSEEGPLKMPTEHRKLEGKDSESGHYEIEFNIVALLLRRRQEHIEAVAEIHETLRNLHKYAGVDLPEEFLSV